MYFHEFNLRIMKLNPLGNSIATILPYICATISNILPYIYIYIYIKQQNDEMKALKLDNFWFPEKRNILG
jgi:hypothetical protein